MKRILFATAVVAVAACESDCRSRDWSRSMHACRSACESSGLKMIQYSGDGCWCSDQPDGGQKRMKRALDYGKNSWTTWWPE